MGKDYSFSLQTEFYPQKASILQLQGISLTTNWIKKDLTALIHIGDKKGYLSLKETTHGREIDFQ